MTDLDHIAIAAERHADVWPRYVGELGANGCRRRRTGFSPAQVRFAGGMRMEVLEPLDVEHNDFLRRFLDRNGPGPHHLTFKLPDLDAAIDGARAMGIEPVGIDRTDPGWQEAFLHPKHACGIVVQLAQADHSWESPPPPDLPVPRADSPAVLTHADASGRGPRSGRRVVRDLLGGRPTGSFTGRRSRCAARRSTWPGPGPVASASSNRNRGPRSSSGWAIFPVGCTIWPSPCPIPA